MNTANTVDITDMHEPATTEATSNLLPCLVRLAQLQHESVDRLAMQEAAQTALAQHGTDPRAQLKTVTSHLQVNTACWLKVPDAARVPALVYALGEQAGAGGLAGEVGQWGVLRGQNAQGQWVSEWWDGATNRWTECADRGYARFALQYFRAYG